jgi:hypothetical protein
MTAAGPSRDSPSPHITMFKSPTNLMSIIIFQAVGPYISLNCSTIMTGLTKKFDLNSAHNYFPMSLVFTSEDMN